MSSEDKIIPNSFQTPNIYIDELMPFLTDPELRCLFYATRRIMGFRKTSDHISVSQFCNGAVLKSGKARDYGTGLGRSAASEALDSLAHFGILIKVSDNDVRKNEGAEYALNLDYDKIDFQGLIERRAEWDVFQKARTSAGRAAKAMKKAADPFCPTDHPQSVPQTTPSLSDRLPPFCPTDHPQSVPQTTPSLSDRLTKTSLKPGENQLESQTSSSSDDDEFLDDDQEEEGREEQGEPGQLSEDLQADLLEFGIFPALLPEVAASGWEECELRALMAWLNATEDAGSRASLFVYRLRANARASIPEEYLRQQPGYYNDYANYSQQKARSYAEGPYAAFIEH